MLSINFDSELERIENLINALNKLDDKIVNLNFIGINEFSRLSGWSIKTVQDLYNRPDFPSTDLGKEKKAEVHAIINYFSVPRRRR